MHRESMILQSLKFLGTAPSDEESVKKLEALWEEIEDRAVPRMTCRQMKKEEWIKAPYFPLEGKDVEDLLKNGEELVFFAGTMGAYWERQLMEKSLTDPLEAYFLDALLSARVEEGLNEFQEQLAEEAAPLYVTDRFSPGYGDFPFALQRPLGEFLNIERTLGVRFTEGGLLIPRKTVLALCALTKEPPDHRHRGCGSCVLAGKCLLRKNGKRCSVYGG